MHCLSHHFVDLLDSLANISCLQASVEVGLQHGSVIHSLIEVVALHLWHILLYGGSLPIEVPRYWVDMVCHTLPKKS